ncbi:PhnD/SsuA/transferrin family substrate-binding protein [bacterium]|nr:PhnD/SsuA/transferrin family substrate-binding protein [bacterium]
MRKLPQTILKKEMLKTVALQVGCLFFSLMAMSAQAYFQESAYGVRPAGMGEAFVSVADDANTVMYNPAGFARIADIEIMGMYSDLYSNLKARLYTGQSDYAGYHMVSAAIPLKAAAGAFGLAWKQFNSTFYKENTFSLSYGRRLLSQEGLEAGITLKGLQWLVEANDYTTDPAYFPYKERHKWGLTADLGLLAGIAKDFNVGLAIDNIIPVDMGLTVSEVIPIIVRLGLAYRWYWNRTNMDYLQTIFEITARNNVYVPKLGVEAWIIKKIFALRTGINTNRFTSGLSFKYSRPGRPLSLQFDYAFGYSFHIPDNWGSHRVGLTFCWERQEKPKQVVTVIKPEQPAAKTPEIKKPKKDLSQEEASQQILADPEFVKFKQFMEYQEFKEAQKDKAKKSRSSVSRPKIKVAKKTLPVKVIRHQEDRIIIGTETKVLTDLRNIQAVLKQVGYLEEYLESKSGLQLELRRFNSTAELSRALEKGEIDVVLEFYGIYQKLKKQGVARPVLNRKKHGEVSSPYCLIVREDDQITQLDHLQGKRLGYVNLEDIYYLKKFFFKQLEDVQLGKVFEKINRCESTRACLLALQMKEIDVIVGLKYILSAYQAEQKAMRKGVKIIATSERKVPFAPVAVRTSLSKDKLKKIELLIKICEAMHKDGRGKKILKTLDCDRLVPSKQ